MLVDVDPLKDLALKINVILTSLFVGYSGNMNEMYSDTVVPFFSVSGVTSPLS